MPLRYRQMLPKDVQECADVIDGHPVIGPRYRGRAASDLRAAWLRVLGSESTNAAVFEEPEGGRAAIRGFGLSVVVTDDFVRELKTPPLFWFGAELASRILRGNSPLLSDRQIREENSKGGLNLVVWEALPRPGFDKRSDLYHLMVASFIETNRGYLWKELITSQMESVERIHWAVNAGGLLWSPTRRRYVHSPNSEHKRVVKKPHIIGISRDVESNRAGSWVGSLFDYHPPKCGFSRSEQRLLLKALEGGTDRELSETLAVSLPTIKKMWLSIYRRTVEHLPELNHTDLQSNATVIRRGKEKKRRLLTYLCDHLEELRPFSARLMQKHSLATSPETTLRKRHRSI